jgi:hypothetical protein
VADGCRSYGVTLTYLTAEIFKVPEPGRAATSVNRCFTPPLLGLAPHRRRLRVLELSRATLFEPKRANVAAPGLGANHQPAILQHGIVASPNVFPALTGVGFGVLLDLWEDWTAMPLVVIDGQSVLGLVSWR